MDSDILKPVKIEDLLLLSNIFKQKGSSCIQPYLFLDNWIRWLDKNPDVDGEITCPNGDWSDGTFVAIIRECTYTVFFFTLQKPADRLANALQQTKRIDWKRGPYLYCIHQDMEIECMAVLQNVGQPLEYDTRMICYWISKKKATKFTVKYPDGYYSAPLLPKHAETINSVWPHKFSGSINHITNLIKLNGGTGVFERESKNLCCWMLISEYGALGILQTLENHKRKNLASTLIKDMSKKRAKFGMDSFANINYKNEISKNLFSKLGFEEINTMRYIKFQEVLLNKY